ncbi:MAG: FecR/PupR family sigma factor regulator [Alphaproteobacteria bacterium]
MKRAPSRIDAAATRWVVRMHSDRLTSDDEAAFAAWIAQDSAHRLAYDKQAALWTGIAALRHDGAALAVIEPLLHSGEVDVKRAACLPLRSWAFWRRGPVVGVFGNSSRPKPTPPPSANSGASFWRMARPSRSI